MPRSERLEFSLFKTTARSSLQVLLAGLLQTPDSTELQQNKYSTQTELWEYSRPTHSVILRAAQLRPEGSHRKILHDSALNPARHFTSFARYTPTAGVRVLAFCL